MEKRVSQMVVRRLPRYYRHLSELLSSGKERISSNELSARLGFTASQIRQDLNCFGGFGMQGYGYNISVLHAAIGDILGINKTLKTVIMGAGNLGLALCNYTGFEKYNFSLVGVFDDDEQKVGQLIGKLHVRHMSTIEQGFRELMPHIAMLCVPKSQAYKVAERLSALGIRGIWNFTSVDLTQLSDTIKIENVHLSDSLMTLAYQMGEYE